MQKIIVSVWHGSLKQSFSKFPLFVEFFAASLINQRIWIPTNCTEPGDLQSHPVAQAFHLFEPPRWCQSFLCTLDPRSCHQLFDSTAAAGLGWDDWRGWCRATTTSGTSSRPASVVVPWPSIGPCRIKDFGQTSRCVLRK